MNFLVAAEAAPAGVSTEVALREAALQALLSERGSAESFAAAVELARKHGVGRQALLEAGFLYHVDRRDEAAIVAMLPDMLAARDAFRLEESAICSVREDWLAIVEYAQALAAMRRGDGKAFKAHITEAFWLSPGQASAYAPWIEEYQTREAARLLRVALEQVYQPLYGGEHIPLARLADGKKALLLHFWSPWSSECEQSLPDFIRMAEALQGRGVAVLSLVADVPAPLAQEARDVLQSHRPGSRAGVWGVDGSSRSLARQLRVRNLPWVALVRLDGSVAYLGPPGSEACWSALKQLDAGVERPAAGSP